jgi:hypothetical protein
MWCKMISTLGRTGNVLFLDIIYLALVAAGVQQKEEERLVCLKRGVGRKIRKRTTAHAW